MPFGASFPAGCREGRRVGAFGAFDPSGAFVIVGSPSDAD
jgi:hypothetical protein